MIITKFSADDFEAIPFQNGQHPRIQIKPMYYELGFSPCPQIFGRKIVLTQLIKALSFIPDHFGFLIWDIYRPREVQGRLFNWMREEIRSKYPHLTDAENEAQTKKYMSAPSKIGDDYCPPHLSGGAIDLTLFDIRNGIELDMGTVFDDCTDRACTDYFEKQSNLTPAEIKIKEARTLLRAAMENAGFRAYQYEWWHFDIGNLFWSAIVHKPAVFGPLFGDKEWP